MRRVDFGAAGERIVFVLGFGNRPEHDGVSWLIDQFTDAGYQVSAFELPRTITDFETEYLEPVASFVSELSSCRVVSHSTGGLIARYLDDSAIETRTYCSPWWGFHESLQHPLLGVLLRLPISRPILPASTAREALGELASDAWLADAPDYVAPTFLREARRAQQAMLPFDDGDVVFYSPTDSIVSSAAIEEQTPAANRVAYSGGHELFCSRSRSEHLDTLLAAIDGNQPFFPSGSRREPSGKKR